MVRQYWMAVVIAAALIGPLPASEPTAKESTPDKGESANRVAVATAAAWSA